MRPLNVLNSYENRTPSLTIGTSMFTGPASVTRTVRPRPSYSLRKLMLWYALGGRHFSARSRFSLFERF
jgi:hypothetical protein